MISRERNALENGRTGGPVRTQPREDLEEGIKP